MGGSNYSSDDLRRMGVVEDPEKPGQYVKATSTRGKEITAKQATTSSPALDLKAKIETERKSSYFKGLNTQQIMAQYCGEPAGLYIPYDVPTYKNNQKLYVKKLADGRTIPGTTHSDLWKEYVKVTANYYESYRRVFHEMVGQKRFPLTVKFIFIRATHQEFDYCNLAQGISDIMIHEDNGWIPDDSSKYLIPDFSEGFGVDRFNPGVIIKL